MDQKIPTNEEIIKVLIKKYPSSRTQIYRIGSNPEDLKNLLNGIETDRMPFKKEENEILSFKSVKVENIDNVIHLDILFDVSVIV